MRRVLLVTAIAGCGFSSPRPGTPDGDTPGADAPGDAAGDAAADAPTFDPRSCPEGYDLTLASVPTSRYRIVTSNAVFTSQRTVCATSGITHMIALETAAEAAEISTALRGVPSPATFDWYYVGAVQRKDQSTPDVAWLWLIGGAVSPMIWGVSGTRPEPDDENGNENNAQNLAVLDATMDRLIDVSGSAGYGVVCECDGRPTVPAIEAELP